MKVTIKDIAKVAGVSHSTVSRALNDNPKISEATREKIKKIAKSMNFEFNSSARSLKSNRTDNIAVIYEAHVDQFGFSLYLDQLFIEVRHTLESMGMDAILLESDHPETGDSNIQRLIRQQKVDGFLIVHDYISIADYNSIKEAGLPVVQLHMIPKHYGVDNLDGYYTDHKFGGKLATSHLIEKGCKNILNIRPEDTHSIEYELRTQGYREALIEAGLPINDNNIYKIDCSYLGGYNLVDYFGDRLNDIDGIFFQADILAFGFISGAVQKGYKIPEDIKVIGFDNAPICESVNPPLTTIHQPRVELATMACERIVYLINNKDTKEHIYKVNNPMLVQRKSC